MKFKAPAASRIFISPSHRAMAPISPSARVTADLAESKLDFVTSSIFPENAATATEISIITSQIVFIGDVLAFIGPPF